MSSIEKAFIDSMILSRQVMEDSEVSSIIQEYFDGKVDAHKSLFKMMELAVSRARKLKMSDRAASVIHSDRRKVTDVNGTQYIDDSTMDNAMAIPALEAIFANAKPEDYLNQVLAVAVHQAWVLQKIEASLKLQ